MIVNDVSADIEFMNNVPNFGTNAANYGEKNVSLFSYSMRYVDLRISCPDLKHTDKRLNKRCGT